MILFIQLPGFLQYHFVSPYVSILWITKLFPDHFLHGFLDIIHSFFDNFQSSLYMVFTFAFLDTENKFKEDFLKSVFGMP